MPEVSDEVGGFLEAAVTQVALVGVDQAGTGRRFFTRVTLEMNKECSKKKI